MDKSHIIALFIGSFTTLLGVLVAHRFTVGRDRTKEFNKAASEFHAAFIPELRCLDYKYFPSKRTPDVYKILSCAFDKHEIAVIKFMPYLLNSTMRNNFKRTWDEYCDKQDNIPYFINRSWEDSLIVQIKTQKLYLARIKHLLTFAKPK